MDGEAEIWREGATTIETTFRAYHRNLGSEWRGSWESLVLGADNCDRVDRAAPQCSARSKSANS